MKLEFSGQIFKKYPNMNFRENPSVGAELFHADRQGEANSRFSQFCEGAKKCTVIFDNVTINQTGADMIIFRFSIGQT
jgi:hypothetical protein